MLNPITRRRFVTIAAAAALMPRGAGAAAPSYRWRGVALGAEASMTLVGIGPDAGAAIARRVEGELERLENIFSLYRSASALARLNREGSIDAPPPELLEVLSLSGALHGATDGAFDPTVQPLWQVHASAASRGAAASPADIRRARDLVGWNGVRIDAGRIDFALPGMALTLNGIAQGYVTDRIAALLAAEGLGDLLVHMGETRAAGTRPDGEAWRAAIVGPGTGLLREVTLAGRALATSAPDGTLIDRRRGIGHIFDPATGMTAAAWDVVSVSAPRAAVADGLSTAFCLMTRAQIDRAMAGFADARIEALA